MRSWLLKQGEVGEGEWVVILRGKEVIYRSGSVNAIRPLLLF
jgi:hypothetical protein